MIEITNDESYLLDDKVIDAVLNQCAIAFCTERFKVESILIDRIRFQIERKYINEIAKRDNIIKSLESKIDAYKKMTNVVIAAHL